MRRSEVGRRAYLDIETTGLSREFCELTVVGVAIEGEAGLELVQQVGDEITAERLAEVLCGVERVYTYNGSRFDLPFIRAKLGVDVKGMVEHRDLMYDCWKQDLKGGLKAVERQLGIARELKEVDGYMAVRLWWDYVNGSDAGALEVLLAYNAEDVVNLEVLRQRLGVD